MKQRSFLGGMFSESDGTPSSSRFIMLIANLVWFGMLIVRFHHTGQLPSQTELLAGGVGVNATYAINQFKQIIGAMVPNPPQVQVVQGNESQKGKEVTQ